MNVEDFFHGLDRLFSEGNKNQIESYFQENLNQAEQEKDIGARITTLNEKMGYYRETASMNKQSGVLLKLWN